MSKTSPQYHLFGDANIKPADKITTNPKTEVVSKEKHGHLTDLHEEGPHLVEQVDNQ